jgi:hypothetical protein
MEGEGGGGPGLAWPGPARLLKDWRGWEGSGQRDRYLEQLQTENETEGRDVDRTGHKSTPITPITETLPEGWSGR